MLKKLKLKKANPSQDSQKTNKRKLSKRAILNIIAYSFLILTHIAIILAIFLSYRYYSIYPSLFGSIVSIVVCLLIIVDIVFFVGFNHKDLALKIISCVLALFLLIGGTVGSFYIAKVNGAVNSILDDGSSNKYETYSGVFVCYDKYNTFTSLTDLKDQRVGLLAETTNGISYIAKNELSDAKVDCAIVEYNTNTELITALVDGDIDAAVITSAYREMYSLERDENSPFAQYLDKFIDFYSFEQELKTTSNKTSKNLSTDPFNVLLIGYSRTDIGSSVGLADAIIVATINPQTYTVSMMSIARDSFVPISCYGGEYDKINSGRSTSRACFIQTVEDFIGMDIDYYMELDYLGLVAIVNKLGGIEITNPVSFELDGIYVPEGTLTADGQQVLQFCRERHHMPNGDFDRQQHQKEVITAICKKFIESGDVTLALDCMEAASEWMSTDFTLSQLTTVFNLLLNTKNYTSLDTFDLVDFHTLRMTGSGGLMYYSYSYELPLWVYLIYKGSYDESINEINEVLGNYSSISQDRGFEFSGNNPYDRPLFYSLEYDNVFMYTPDPMPAYWANLEGMTTAEAMAWASSNGVTLTISEVITAADSRYDASLEGTVYDQSVRYGTLISKTNTGTIVVMGSAEIDESKMVPDFVGYSYSKAVEWADKYGIKIDIDFNTSVEGEVGKVVDQSPAVYTDIKKCSTLEITVKAGTYKIKFDKNGHGLDSELPSTMTVTTGDKVQYFNTTMSSDTDSEGTKYVFTGWYDSSGNKVTSTNDVTGSNGSTVTIYAHWNQLHSVTFNNDGTEKTYYTSESFPTNPEKIGYIFEGWYTESGDKITSFDSVNSNIKVTAKWTKCEDHSYEIIETVDATCESGGYITKQCTKCGYQEETTIDKLIEGCEAIGESDPDDEDPDPEVEEDPA